MTGGYPQPVVLNTTVVSKLVHDMSIEIIVFMEREITALNNEDIS